MSAAAEAAPALHSVGFERIGDGVFALTVDDVVLTLNETEARWLGLRIETEIGSAWSRTLKPKER